MNTDLHVSALICVHRRFPTRSQVALGKVAKLSLAVNAFPRPAWEQQKYSLIAMKIRFKPQEQKYDYFDIFGPASEEGDCFVSQHCMTHSIGQSNNIFLFFVDIIYIFIQKILPRISIPVAVVYAIKDLLTYNGQIVAYIIVLVLLFIKFPPAIETLYLINKYDNSDDTFIKLLELSKNQSIGICVFNKSFVIKHICKLGIERTFQNLLKYINISNYEIIFHHKSKKELEEHFKMLSRRGHIG